LRIIGGCVISERQENFSRTGLCLGLGGCARGVPSNQKRLQRLNVVG
jgi:hypothetical protein